MKFSEEHIKILERHYPIWECLSVAGYVKNLDKAIFNELYIVHNEALTPAHFTHWCNVCVADMIRIIYTAYERYKAESEDFVAPMTKKERKKSIPVVEQGLFE